MRALATPLALAACAALLACDQPDTAGAAPDAQPTAPVLTPVPPPPPEVLAALRSAECVDVAQFYFESFTQGDFANAALVWDDPVVDSARLEAVLADYREPQIAWNEPALETGNGPPRCTVTGTLTDSADGAVPPRQGSVTFTRIPEDSGPEGGASRWQAVRQTFVEELGMPAGGS